VIEGERAYSEQDVKATLDRCRLTYVYEPDRARLRSRISRMLAGGMLVAWFQGRAVCGSGVPRRAVICDPSNRWARENVNRFFREVPIDTPIPIVAPVGTATWHNGDLQRCAAHRIVVDPAWRHFTVGAADGNGFVDAQGVVESDDDGLFALIREHQARTGVPALIAVPFCASAEVVVGTPREAIRTMFSSSIDVLAIERFVVAKDHWILGNACDPA
jgi:carbamoyltransferase